MALTDRLGREVNVGDFVIVKDSFGIVYHLTEELRGYPRYRILTVEGHSWRNDGVFFSFSKSTGHRYRPWRMLIEIPPDIVPVWLHHIVHEYKGRIIAGDVPSTTGQERFYAPV